MPVGLSPNQSNIQAALASFLSAVTGLTPGTTIISGQNNRVPEPAPPAFIVMTPIRFERLETNLDTYADVKFTGSIAGTVLTVSTIILGTVTQGATLTGLNLLPGTVVGTQLSGVGGGAGTYTVSPTQTVATQTISAGGQTLTQGAECVVQLDFHSADLTAGDLAQAVSTAFRDEYATDFFAGLAVPLNGIAPLWADDPRQAPFLNAENAYEWRWTLDARLQANQALSIPQEFADSVTVTPIGVQVKFPAH